MEPGSGRGRRLAAALIVGDRYLDKEVTRLLNSLEPHVEGLFVSYNGTKSRFPSWGKKTSIPIKWGRFKWVDDFSAARDHSFSLVPKKKFDWILWIDTDDVFVAPQGLEPIWESLDGYTEGVFLRYAYAVEPDTGEVVVEQWRERILSTQWPWKWKWPVHECATGPPGTQFARRDEAWIEHQRKSGDERGARERNRRIISRAMEKSPDEPRYLYYHANETLAEATNSQPGPQRDRACDEAIASYRRFVAAMAANQTDDVYNAAVRIGDLYMLKGSFNEAIDAYLQAAKFYPGWADAYVGISKAMMEAGDFPRMRDFADIACNLSKPSTTAAIEPMSSSFHPRFLRGIGREETGNIEGALEDYEAAIEIWRPPNGELDKRIEHLREKLKDHDGSHEATWDVRKKLRGSRPERSIAFFTNPIPELWNYETLAQSGHGGSETLVLQTAELFARDGWRAVIFGTPGSDARGLQENGVEMYNFDEWLPNEPFTVFVSSRAGDPFTAPINAKAKFLWMHDVNAGPNFKNVADEPDAIVCLTEWHARHLSMLYSMPRERFTVIHNGIELEKFTPRTSWDGNPRFFWGSSPDRGLDTLLGLWPHIRNISPAAELEIFYGWNFIDTLIAQGSPTSQWLMMMKEKIVSGIHAMGGEDAGIFWRGRVGPDALREAMYRCHYWAYPTQFMETFCLTAVMCQAAGVVPIASRLGGLGETVGFQNYCVEGWPLNTSYQNQFMLRLSAALGDSGGERMLLDKARRIGREHAEKFSLEASYSAWNKLFSEHGIGHSRSSIIVPREPIGVGSGVPSGGSG